MRRSNNCNLQPDRLGQQCWNDVQNCRDHKLRDEQGIGARALQGTPERHGRVFPARSILVKHLQVPADPFGPGVEREHRFKHGRQQHQRQENRQRSRRQHRGRQRDRGPDGDAGGEDAHPHGPALAHHGRQRPIFVQLPPVQRFRPVDNGSVCR